jgi:hypothetical protein
MLDSKINIHNFKFLEFTALKTINSFFSSSPYERPCRLQDYKEGMFNKNLKIDEVLGNSSLLANRLLDVIYEQDLVFLPKENFSLEEFNEFYNLEFCKEGQVLKNTLENFIFGFLEKEISIVGKWNLESFLSYTKSVFEEIKNADSGLKKCVQESKDSKSATRFYLIQCASDFLTEASAMGRNVLGNYDKHLSELFKIFIDEYGYGVHSKKHSRLFEDLIERCEMNSQPHYYWQFYTASSLMMTNYFHYISKNHKYFFRYIGALYFTETALSFISKHQAQLVKIGFGKDFDTLYFDEHDHIDKHHGRMALEDLIIPMVKQYGEEILIEMLIGFNQFKLLGDLADEEFTRHIKWHDSIEIKKTKDFGYDTSKAITFNEPEGEVSNIHSHDKNELFFCIEGSLEFVCSPYKSFVLNSGEALIIPKFCIHGTKILSKECKYGALCIE